LYQLIKILFYQNISFVDFIEIIPNVEHENVSTFIMISVNKNFVNIPEKR
jgi:hypothetical protein